MGPRGSWIRFAGIVLMSVLVVALGQPATSPATESQAFVVTAAEEVLGTWVSQMGAVAVRFDEDATLRSARSVGTLGSAPYAINSYRFEDGVMLVTELEVSGVPSCGEAVGRYKVWRLDGGNLHIVAIDDLCEGRSSDMTREYEPTESAGYVVVTFPEQILGSWVSTYGGAAIRFDDDGTYREAWGVSMLDVAPFVISTYGFDAAVMLVVEGTVAGVPSCGEAVGRYEVRLLESGSMQMVVIEDACIDRREHMRSGVYERVE
jgi:hypothetical protein